MPQVSCRGRRPHTGVSGFRPSVKADDARRGREAAAHCVARLISHKPISHLSISWAVFTFFSQHGASSRERRVQRPLIGPKVVINVGSQYVRSTSVVFWVVSTDWPVFLQRIVASRRINQCVTQLAKVQWTSDSRYDLMKKIIITLDSKWTAYSS